MSEVRRVFGVGELLSGLRQLLEDRIGRLWVAGEVSGLHRARSGHCYFTLKDEAGQLRAALFRGAARRVPFDLEDGLEVVALVDVTIYEPRGELQVVVQQLEPRGQGALQLAVEQLRRRLEAEGLFDAERKRPLPVFPRRIGVVTSPGAAALRDVVQVTGRRFPATPLLLSPTPVQGAGAELEIAAAIGAIAAQDGVDVVLVVRGGGSLEDLMAFNTEPVARAIAACPVPVVSGVGHEVDVSLADLAADVRAPTPSAAAALVTPDRETLRQQLARDWRRLAAAARGRTWQAGSRLARHRDSLRAHAPLARLAARRAALEAAARALVHAGRRDHERRAARLAAWSGRLESLSPLAVLSRGYALVRLAGPAGGPEGPILRRATQARPGDRLAIRLAEGRLRARVEPDADT